MIPIIPSSKSDNRLVRVLIVDDMPQVRQELRQLLELTEWIEIVGEAGNGQEAIQQVGVLRPAVVIMDLEMPILDGIEATRYIKQLRFATRVVILSVHSESDDLNRARRAGADAFIEKGSPYARLIKSIRPCKV